MANKDNNPEILDPEIPELGDESLPEDGADDPVPDLLETIRDAAWQGPFGDAMAEDESDALEDPGGDSWVRDWPEPPWAEEPWPDEVWPEDSPDDFSSTQPEADFPADAGDPD